MKFLRFSLAFLVAGSSLIGTSFAQSANTQTFTITNNSNQPVLVYDDKGNKAPVGGSNASAPGWELDKSISNPLNVCWTTKNNPTACPPGAPFASAVIPSNGQSAKLVISGQCNLVKDACTNMPSVTFSN